MNELSLFANGGGQCQTIQETRELEIWAYSHAVTAAKEEVIFASTQQTLESNEGGGVSLVYRMYPF